jgi:hypothetical protein
LPPETDQELKFDYALLDDLALAVDRRSVDPQDHLTSTRPEKLGPLVELAVQSRTQGFASLSINKMRSCPIVDAVRAATDGVEGGAESVPQLGVIRTDRDFQADDQTQWYLFCRRAQQAAEAVGIPRIVAKQLVGALREIEENVHRHSQRSNDGLVGYRAGDDEFEFVVADSGVGVLRSLASHPDYAHLRDWGTAIRLAIADGNSRYGRDSGHGYGFHDLFVGLSNLGSSLRFRSGDHALTIADDTPTSSSGRLEQKAFFQGFLIAISCRSALRSLH